MKRHNPFPVPDPFQKIYAHGVEVSQNSRLLYVSGQVGVDGNEVLAEGFENQCIQAIANIEKILSSARMALKDVVKINVFLTRREDLPLLRKVRLDQLAVAPAVTVVIVSGLNDPDWLVEIEAVGAAAN